MLWFASELFVVQISGLWVLGTVKHNTIPVATLTPTAPVTRLCWTATTQATTVVPTHIARAITLRAKQMKAKRKRRKYLLCTVCSYKKLKQLVHAMECIAILELDEFKFGSYYTNKIFIWNSDFKLNIINRIKNNWDVFGIKLFCVMLYLILSVNIAQSNAEKTLLFCSIEYLVSTLGTKKKIKYALQDIYR